MVRKYAEKVELVDKAKVPPPTRQAPGTWSETFTSMGPDQAIKITVGTMEEARRVRLSMTVVFRRLYGKGILHTRIVPESPSVVAVYAWRD